MFLSYDICRLFTNISLEKTSHLAADFIFKPNLKISKTDCQNYFYFAPIFFIKRNGTRRNGKVAMGSTLAPTIANLLMGYHEKNLLQDFDGEGPHFYRKYVDNVTAVSENKDNASSFLTSTSQFTKKW